MKDASVTALDAARRIWVQSTGDASDPRDVSAIAASLFDRTRTGLSRWIGEEGYRILLERSLGVAREENPWLGSLSSVDDNSTVVRAATQRLGEAAASEGIVAVLATIIELLGRIVGEVVALRLVEQAGAPAHRDGASTQKEHNTDG